MELMTLKAYIEINLANRFIRLYKSIINTLIFFNWKSNGSFLLCVNYRGLNKLTIKNQYLFALVGRLLDWLGKAKQFI